MLCILILFRRSESSTPFEKKFNREDEIQLSTSDLTIDSRKEFYVFNNCDVLKENVTITLVVCCIISVNAYMEERLDLSFPSVKRRG